MTHSTHNALLNRRKALLSSTGMLTAGSALALAAGTSEAHAGSPRVHGPVLDIATRFSTFRVSLPDGANEPSPIGVPRGASFLLEGEIFEGGTITPGLLFDIEAHIGARIGHWFCWGNIIATVDRPDPHVVSTQEYVFGEISPQAPFPPDKLISGGMEGSLTPAHNPQMRAVLGGSGRFAGASGHLAQFLIGQNTDVDPTGLNSSTLRFAFDIDTRRSASVDALTRRAGL